MLKDYRIENDEQNILRSRIWGYAPDMKHQKEHPANDIDPSLIERMVKSEEMIMSNDTPVNFQDSNIQKADVAFESSSDWMVDQQPETRDYMMNQDVFKDENSEHMDIEDYLSEDDEMFMGAGPDMIYSASRFDEDSVNENEVDYDEFDKAEQVSMNELPVEEASNVFHYTREDLIKIGNEVREDPRDTVGYQKLKDSVRQTIVNSREEVAETSNVGGAKE